MVSAPKISMSGEAMRLLQHVAQIALAAAAARPARKRLRFELLGAERFHHLVAAERLLQDLVQLRGMVLRAAAGAADAPAEARGRHQHEGQHRQADQRQLPIRVQDHEQQARTTKVCRSKSASMCEIATWIFSMSFMMDDIRRPVEWFRRTARPGAAPCRRPCCAGR